MLIGAPNSPDNNVMGPEDICEKQSQSTRPHTMTHRTCAIFFMSFLHGMAGVSLRDSGEKFSHLERTWNRVAAPLHEEELIDVVQ